MKKSTLAILISLVVAALFGIVLIAGAASYILYSRFHATPFSIANAALLEPTPFVDPTAGFQIRPPLGWRPNPKSLTLKFRIWACPTPDFIDGRPSIANINIGTDTYNGTDYAADAIRLHQHNHTDFHLNFNRRLTINGRVAQMIDYTYTTKAGVPLHVQQTMIASGNTVYLVTALTHQKSWESHRLELESSAASIEITR